jgi:hypothetical protein
MPAPLACAASLTVPSDNSLRGVDAEQLGRQHLGLIRGLEPALAIAGVGTAHVCDHGPQPLEVRLA